MLEVPSFAVHGNWIADLLLWANVRDLTLGDRQPDRKVKSSVFQSSVDPNFHSAIKTNEADVYLSSFGVNPRKHRPDPCLFRDIFRSCGTDSIVQSRRLIFLNLHAGFYYGSYRFRAPVTGGSMSVSQGDCNGKYPPYTLLSR